MNDIKGMGMPVNIFSDWRQTAGLNLKNTVAGFEYPKSRKDWIMGLRGPLPSPARLQKLRGTPGKRPLTVPAPQQPGTPIMPASLGPVGITLWEELIAELSHRRTLVAGDKRILEATCMSYENLMTASATIAEKGSTYESDTMNGSIIRPRPEVQQRSDAFRRYVKCLDALGLTPNSRMRLQILQVPDRSPEDLAFDEFFSPTT